MMSDAALNHLSRSLVSILRHQARNKGIIVSDDGFARVDDVLRLRRLHGACRESIEQVVGTSRHHDGTPRFELRQNRHGEWLIRAMRHRSMAGVDPGAEPSDLDAFGAILVGSAAEHSGASEVVSEHSAASQVAAEPTMPEDVASSSSAAPPQSLGKSCPKSTRLLEAGKVTGGEGLVNQAYMTRGYELKAIRQEAEQSWNKSLGLLGGAEEPLIQELDPTVDQSACWHLPTVPGSVSHEWDKQHVASSSGYATEQPVQARPTQACPQKDAMDAMD